MDKVPAFFLGIGAGLVTAALLHIYDVDFWWYTMAQLRVTLVGYPPCPA